MTVITEKRLDSRQLGLKRTGSASSVLSLTTKRKEASRVSGHLRGVGGEQEDISAANG